MKKSTIFGITSIVSGIVAVAAGAAAYMYQDDNTDTVPVENEVKTDDVEVELPQQ